MFMSVIDEFDKLEAVVRFILFLYKHPGVGITKIIRESSAGQKALESARDFLFKEKLIETYPNPEFPHNLLLRLTEKGQKVAEHLAEIERILEE